MKKLVFAVLSLISTSALAHDGFYTGIQAGIMLNGLDASNNYVSTFQVLKENNNQLAGRLFVGYDFNKYFAVEAGYLMTTNLMVRDIGYQSKEIANFKIKEQVADLVGKGSFYMGDKFYIYGKAGLAYINVKDKANSLSYEVSKQDNKSFNIVYGVGLGYDISENISADISWTRYNGQKNSASDLIDGNFKPQFDFCALSITYKI